MRVYLPRLSLRFNLYMCVVEMGAETFTHEGFDKKNIKFDRIETAMTSTLKPSWQRVVAVIVLAPSGGYFRGL